MNLSTITYIMFVRVRVCALVGCYVKILINYRSIFHVNYLFH